MTHHTHPSTTSRDHSTSSDELRFDTLSGFQRDILRALYALDAYTPDRSASAIAVREMLRSYPHYDNEEPASSRYYPSTLRLADRGWLNIHPDTRDARRRHYHLTKRARVHLDRVTAAETGLHHTSTEPSPSPDTIQPEPEATDD